VLDVTGQPIQNVEIALEKNKQSLATTRTDSLGHFDLKTVKKGDYELLIKLDGWDTLRWPTRIKTSIASKACKRPIFISLAPRTGMGCWSGITMEKPNQLNAKTH